MRTQKANGERHKVFDKGEADEIGVEYKSCHAPDVEPGDWVLTDDGHVVQCLNVSITKRIRISSGWFTQRPDRGHKGGRPVSRPITIDRMHTSVEKGKATSRKLKGTHYLDDWYQHRFDIARAFVNKAFGNWQEACLLVIGRVVRYEIIHFFKNDPKVCKVVAEEFRELLRRHNVGTEDVAKMLGEYMAMVRDLKDPKAFMIGIEKLLALNEIDNPEEISAAIRPALPGAFQYGQLPEPQRQIEPAVEAPFQVEDNGANGRGPHTNQS